LLFKRRNFGVCYYSHRQFGHEYVRWFLSNMTSVYHEKKRDPGCGRDSRSWYLRSTDLL